MAHHEPLKALGPIDWSDVSHDNLKHFLTSTFADAQTVIDSIPTPPAQSVSSSPGRARSHTDSSVLHPLDGPPPPYSSSGRDHANTTANESEAAAAASAHAAAQLQKDWKEVKVPPKDNPVGAAVYKLAAKDGRGAWFARRSTHAGISFDKFRLGLEREFAETLKAFSGPGTGNVRGIGAERRAESRVCDGLGVAEVWLLSAQFPGPTTPRDFVTLLLTESGKGEEQEESRKGKRRRRSGPRQFMIVSKPCGHPECAPRSGYIRGSYESVEIIREVSVDVTPRRTRSSVDLGREDVPPPSLQPGGDHLGREAVLRSAARLKGLEAAADRHLARSMSELPSPSAADGGGGMGPFESEAEMAVEWIMVTRSDPGGSVPRFMVEKGTPAGIINDAGRFLRWLEAKSEEDLENPADDSPGEQAARNEAPVPAPAGQPAAPQHRDTSHPAQQPDQEPPSGLYTMITGALGMASSAVASRLPAFASTSGPAGEADDTTGDSDSDESDRSYASAPEPDPVAAPAALDAEATSLMSGRSNESGPKTPATQHEKQLKKLQERYRKLEEKRARQQERSLQGKSAQGDGAIAKLREKHEKEVAKQQESYRKEMKKLEEKRLKDERKAEEKRRKEAEKDARNRLAMELDRTRIERDMALKQVEILKDQVVQLQAENTRLAASLDRAAEEASRSGDGNVKVDAEKASQRSSRSK